MDLRGRPRQECVEHVGGDAAHAVVDEVLGATRVGHLRDERSAVLLPPQRAGGEHTGTRRSRVVGDIGERVLASDNRRGVAEHLDVRGRARRLGCDPVVLVAHEAGKHVAVAKAGAVEDPRSRVDHHHVGVDRVRFVEVADERALRVRRWVEPPARGDAGVVDAVERVFLGDTKIDLAAERTVRRRLEADAPEDGVGPEKDEVDARVARALESLSHLERVVLVVRQRHDRFVAPRSCLIGTGMEIDVGRIGDVDAHRLDLLYELELATEEVT